MTRPATANDPLAARRDSAVEWLMGRINYERVAVVPYSERQLKLDRMRQLLTRLGSPDAGRKIIHIAGTKGKGSTAAMIASILTAAGLRTGVYSSPHLERIEERWKVDNQPIDAQTLVGLVDRLRPVAHAMDQEGDPPTYFDLTTAMALVHFADQQCDAVVLEVGLGGRLDSTNVCLPVVSVITSISLDHTRQLGETLGEIAGEKAGIIKPGVPVVSGVTAPEPREVIRRVARDHGCRLLERGVDFAAEGAGPIAFWRRDAADEQRLDDLRPSLRGPHQVANAAVALAVISELRDQGWAISTEACREGLTATRLPGRVEWFEPIPDKRAAAVVDTAHNEASAQALVDSIDESHNAGPRTLVLAISRDKKVEAIVRQLAPRFDRVIATRYVDNPRAVDPEELAALVRDAGGREVAECDSPQQALRDAFEATPLGGLVVVTGSFFIAAELRPMIASPEA